VSFDAEPYEKLLTLFAVEVEYIAVIDRASYQRRGLLLLFAGMMAQPSLKASSAVSSW
jgi:hypothetical protein